MVNKLKDFIRAIRACKTAADERSVIARESAAVRTSFKEDSSIESRHNNMAKLLYIHMLGHPAHFGQIECLKLVAGGKYADKRLGYLGIMLLLDESQEVLTLVTNSLKNDMNSSNMYTVGLALCTMGNICSSEMARDLSPEVDKLLASNNSYIKKKAALCAYKALKKVPELLEQFIAKAKMILNERNHAVLLAGMTLITEICTISPEYQREFRSMVSHLNRHLKSLLTAGSSPEHDVNGINDPFLQVKILRLMRILGRGDRDASEAMNDILAQVATNTDGSKNVGNSILYETCLTIMEIEADSGLRVLAVNLLGRFLANTDNNIKYVALNTLTKTITVDVNAVQRHRATVLECLRDSDVSIRRRALDLCFYLINESNIRMMVRELLVFLEVADSECKSSMPSRICNAADQFAPNKRWHIDTVIRVFKLAGNYVKEDVLSNFIKIVASVPEFHTYACYKLFYSLKQDLSQESLVLAGVWCIGEYGDSLLQNGPPKSSADDGDHEPSIVADEMIKNVSDRDVVDLMETILESPYNSPVITEYSLTALLKLTSRISNGLVTDRIKSVIRKYHGDIDLEIQQRSVEYSTLLSEASLERFRAAVLERVPVPPPIAPSERKAQGDRPGSSVSNPSPAPGAKVSIGNASVGGNLLDDLLSLNIGSSTPAPAQSAPFGGASKNIDLLADVFGAAPSLPSAGSATGAKSKSDILDLFGGSNVMAAPVLSQAGGGMSMGGSSAGFGNLDLLGGGFNATPAATVASPNQSSKYDVFASLGGDFPRSGSVSGASSAMPPLQQQQSSSGFSMGAASGLGGMGMMQPQQTSPMASSTSGLQQMASFSNQASPSAGAGFGSPAPGEVVAYNKNGLTITFAVTVDQSSAAMEPQSRTISILATFKNTGASPIGNLTFQVAVPKSLKLQLMPASSNVVPAGGNATQSMKITNPVGGTPEGRGVVVKLRLKLMYSSAQAGNVDEIVDFPGFNNFSW